MIEHTELRYGPASRNRLREAADSAAQGARAALESFYYALNNADLDALRGVWTEHPLAQLNNPVGGILRSGTDIADLYGRIFAGSMRLQVEFGDIVEYLGGDHAVFAGRETGSYGPARTPLAIRTTRYFRYSDGRWVQFHHHGSIDDAAALDAYQKAAG